jgi:hypothetical protein
MKIRTIVLAGVAIAAVFTTIHAAGVYTDVRNVGTKKELQLTGFSKKMMANYDQGRSRILDELGVAGEKRDAIDKILKDAIEARRFAGSGGAVDRNAFISAVKEAYPDTSGTNIYDKIADDVIVMRKQFAADQAQLADEVQSYNTWRKTGGLFHPLFVSIIGYPSDSLEFTVNGHAYKGPDALDKMSRVIITNESGQIFDSGQDQRLPIGNPKP